jgi:hypothetical protein
VSNDRTQTPFEVWRAWQCYLAGDDGEDLAEVFTRVRLRGSDATRMRWARDWRTRAFCDLGLHLLYQQILGRTSNPLVRLQASRLAEAAATMVENPDDAGALSVQRFIDTWRQQSAYCDDLIAYLFRPAPYLRRLTVLHPEIEELSYGLPLGEWIRQSAVREIRCAAADPLVIMHTVVESLMPSAPMVRDRLHRLRRARLQMWAGLYEKVLSSYGLRPREYVDWLSIAEQFSTIAGGAFLRAQTRSDDIERSVDGETLGQIIIEILPSLLEIRPDEIPTRRTA